MNELLAVIFLLTGNMERLKPAFLLVVTSRAAVEGGARLDKLLGLNYSFICELASIHRFEDVC